MRSFRAFTAEELAFVQTFKIGEAQLPAGRTILLEQQPSPNLYTVLSGWLFKYKTLDDGRRQILNFAMPGDLLGLQAATFGEMHHSVDTLSDVTLCVFQKERLWTLYQQHPALGFDVTWLAAQEKAILADYLVSTGQRTASERIAFLLLTLFLRARSVGLVLDGATEFPFNQEHFADAIGFSLVHTNKQLARLRSSGAFEWHGTRFRMIDETKLAALAGMPSLAAGPRPFL